MWHVTIRQATQFVLSFAFALSLVSTARANSICSSVLTADQLRQVDDMVFPAHPYSAHLNEAVYGDKVQGTVKRLTRTDIEKLRGAIAHPFVGAVRDVKSQEDIASLKTWLRSTPSGQFPAWDTAAPERDMPFAWVPRTWIERTSDDFLHLVKESGSVGPIKATTLGAATSQGRTLGVTQHIAADSSGHDAFVWSYIYRAIVGGRLLTTLLAVCQADVVTMSDDERDLRALEQQLTRAWASHDRATIERIFAPEWSLTTPEGATVSRAAYLDATFESNAQIIEAMTTDDDRVTVTRFDAAAAVRGRTVATVVLAGARQTNTVRFTDLFIKREGVWQIVASHQSRAQE